MESLNIKQEVINDGNGTEDTTWDQWKQEVKFDETIKNEEVTPKLISENINIKDEFDGHNLIHVHTGGAIKFLHSVPTVGHETLDVGVKEEPLTSCLNIPLHTNQKLYSSQYRDDHQVLAPSTVTQAVKKLHVCRICKQTCANKERLVLHVRTHTGEPHFACAVCKYKCSRKAYLDRHMRTHTGERPFACDVCKYKCSRKASLNSHMRSHTGERPFACDFCQYKCSQKSNLVSHMRTHTGERHFACDECNYKCSHKAQLQNHMKTHTGERPFACDVCNNYKFSQKASLVIHMRTHTGERPFECYSCKYKCARKDSLVNHMRTHNSDNCGHPKK